MRVRKGYFLMNLGVLLVAAALCLTAYNIYDGQRAARRADELLSLFSAAEPNGILDNRSIFEKYPDMEMPTREAEGLSLIGVIQIPSLDLVLPVCKSWSYDNLRQAPCRYSGSIYKDDCVIAAHNYTGHFGRLKTLTEGAEVIFTDAVGNTFSYSVAAVTTFQPTAVDEMKQSGYDLTLFTCNKSGTARVTVGLDRIKYE